MMLKRMMIIIFGFFLSIYGCTPQRLAINATASLIGFNLISFNEEEDPELAKIAGASNLKLLEGLIKADPSNERLLIWAAQAFGGYAFLFVEDDDSKRAEMLYKRGADYGLRVLKKKGGFKKALKGDIEEFKSSLKDFDKEDISSLFWTTYCWGGRINLNRDSPQALIDIPKVKLLMERILVLNEEYYYGSPHLLLATYYSSRPRMLGGDPEKAKHHFERAVSLNKGKFLMSYFLYARFYAVQVQDEELFKRLIDKVLETSPDILPEQRLSNQVAKRKAKGSLRDMAQYF